MGSIRNILIVSLRRSPMHRMVVCLGLAVLMVAASTLGNVHLAGASRQSGSLASQAAADAAQDGPKVSLPSETIGWVEGEGSDPGEEGIVAVARQAAAVLGWKIQTCDGQGVPTDMQQCMNTLTEDHVAMIAVDAIPQSVLGPGLSRATAAGIKTIYVVGTLNAGVKSIGPATSLFAAGYAPNDAAMGKLLGAYITRQLKSSSAPQLINGGYSAATWGVIRQQSFNAALKGTNVKVVASPQANAANLVQGTEAQMNALLTQYPKTKAVVVTYNGAVVGAQEAVTSLYRGKTYPNAPLVATYLLSPQIDSLIKQGQITAAAWSDLNASIWVGIDQMAQYLGRHKSMSPLLQPNYGAGLNFFKPVIITKANVPSSSAVYPANPVNYVQFFTDKWNKEFKLK
jgi:ABC-type sugar transport system substrate-binding protein